MLTQERLKKLLHYEPGTGVFTWRVQANNNGAPFGGVAGHVSKRGYVRIQIDCHMHLAHRLAWLYVYGEWPEGMLDHRDQDKSNNRISNLRPATNKQNRENVGMYSSNTSGFKGVCWNKRDSNWTAQICHNYKNIRVGYFDTPEEASAAYEAMRDKLFTHHRKEAA